MPLLVAQGPEPTQLLRSFVPENGILHIGRGSDNDCAVTWDRKVSRRHAQLHWDNGEATVSCLEGALNPIIFRGTSCQSARVQIGDEFKIGGTAFQLSGDADDSPESQIRRLLESDDARELTHTQVSLRKADHRVAMVSQYSHTLWLSSGDQELSAALTAILAEVIPHAGAISVLECQDPKSIRTARPKVLHWSGGSETDRLKISRTMVAAAVTQNQSIVRVRREEGLTESSPFSTDRGRWGFCVPIVAGSASAWCIYVSGGFGAADSLPPGLTPDDLAGDVQIAELISQLVGAIRQVRCLEDQFAGMRQFFSPAVVESVSKANDGTTLKPTESETAVLFCDLRGYSKIAEQSKHNLQRLLDRVSQALEVMTSNIVIHDGAIADFQGDSALGFWGWPLPLSEGPLPACRAALEILKTFDRANSASRSSDLKGFRIGIGIACGTAIAGRIGTRQQAKVGVFGPVVNLGSRLEGMTKQIGCPILMDGPTAAAVRKSLSASVGRCRRIGLIRPVGVNAPIDVHQLLLPAKRSELSDANIRDFEAAVDAFVGGDWDEARELLGQMPVKDR
ncbi:MAG: adenylate/guanylate cyclase domain-containing protein, partial [Planctomycetota bacterium]|nr:adenylate/guanylate cyclase domain-containing protein [Planctomycetota bacterium]